MGIFTRLRDIVSSNINAMLEMAEDPEKLLKLMIQEMEDTLIEIKASCAGSMATKKKMERAQGEAAARSQQWGEKAELAVAKGREELAREALVEKRRYQERADSLEQEVVQCDGIIERYQSDIVQLEEKLAAAREKQRILVQRHIHAHGKKRAQKDIRKFDTSDAMVRFEQFENRIERMEAEADLVNFGKKSSIEDEFAELEVDEEIEKELADLKASSEKKKQGE
ncbi:phage shock protein PspA [Candidatus Hydrogenedentota bacterium]